MNLKTLLIAICIAGVIGLSFLAGSIVSMVLAFWAALIIILYFGINPSDTNTNYEYRENFVFLKRIFVVGFILRISVSFFIYYSNTVTPYFFAPDTYYYSFKGWHIAKFWLGQMDEFTYMTTISEWGQNIYFKVHALCYYIIGEQIPFVPATLNCLAGSILPIFSFLIVREFGVHRRCARWVSYLICFWPSLILWSTIGIRDIWSILTFNILLYANLKFRTNKSPYYAILIIICMVVIFNIRAYLLPLTITALFLSFYVSKSKNVLLMLTLSVIAIVGINMLDSMFNISYYLNPSTITTLRSAYASKGSGFVVNADLSSPLGYMKLISVSMIYFIFAPFPWDFGSMLKVVTLPETLFFYTILFYIIRGLRLQMKLDSSKIITLLLLFFVISCSYSLIEPNVGTLYRHKAQVVSLMLIFAPIGFYYRKISLKKIKKVKK